MVPTSSVASSVVRFDEMTRTASTMDGETVMNGEVQGQKFELRTKVTGKRVGPCK